MKTALGLLLLLAMTSEPGRSQTDSTLASRLYLYGRDLFARARYDSAIIFFDSAEVMYRNAEDVVGRVEALNWKSNCLSETTVN